MLQDHFKARSVATEAVTKEVLPTEKANLEDSIKEKRKQDEETDKPNKKSKVEENEMIDRDKIDLIDNSPIKAVQGKLKIVTWNINGIRAFLKNNAHQWLADNSPDVICVQEIKCDLDKIPKEAMLKGYHAYWSSAEKSGYAGTGILSKVQPMAVTYGIGHDEHDQEGRVITAEYKDFYLVNTYVPNSGQKLVRLDYRMTWDDCFRGYLSSLNDKKPVILCGDLNVAHKEIDLTNPKTNQKSAGFTPQERAKFDILLNPALFVDSFRHLYPNKTGAYTFWTYMRNARASNIGWRLDYFLLPPRLLPKLIDVTLHSDVKGSDHCPVAIQLDMTI